MPQVSWATVIQAHQHPEPRAETGTDMAGHRHDDTGIEALIGPQTERPIQDLEVEQEEHEGGREEEQDALHRQAHLFSLPIMDRRKRWREAPRRADEVPMAVTKEKEQEYRTGHGSEMRMGDVRVPACPDTLAVQAGSPASAGE